MEKYIRILFIIKIVVFVFLAPAQLEANIYPFPYSFGKANLLSLADKAAVKSSDILVLGDQNALMFKEFEKTFRSELLNELVTVNIQNLAQPYSGLHRHLKMIDEIQNLPELVFYFASSNEFYEKRINLNSIAAISKNYETLKKDIPVSLMMLFPFLKNFLYESVEEVQLGDLPIARDPLDDVISKQTYIKGIIKTYELELEKLIERVLEEDKTIVLITAPINLDNIPNEVCSNSTSVEINKKLTEHANNLLKGDFKTALIELRKHAETITGNSRYHYLMGRSYSMTGDLKKGKQEFYKANAYDCAPNGASHLINTVLRKYAQNYEVPLIDLERIVNDEFGKNVVFFNKTKPQNLFYERFVKLLASYTNQYFSL